MAAAPPESGIRLYSSTSRGYSSSIASTGRFEVLVMPTCTPSLPSFIGHPPIPPPSVSRYTNGRPLRASVPANTAMLLAPLAAATAPSGSAAASAPRATSMIRWLVWARDETAAGNTALTSVAGSAAISSTSSMPWLFGASGSSSAFSA